MKYSLFFLILFCLPGFLMAGTSANDIENFSVDTQNDGKGGMAILSGLSEFYVNPAFTSFNPFYTVAGTYFFEESFSFGISDGKSKVGGGVLYNRHNRQNTIKTNLSVPLLPSRLIVLGANLAYIDGPIPIIEHTGGVITADFGVALNLMDMIYIGSAITTPFSIYGPHIPMKLNNCVEVAFFDKMFRLNIGTSYHLEHSKERTEYFRPFLKYTDLSAGFEFNYSIFYASFGLNSSSFSKSMSFDQMMKTFAIGFYQAGTAGVFAGFYFRENYYTFSISVIWEPFK